MLSRIFTVLFVHRLRCLISSSVSVVGYLQDFLHTDYEVSLVIVFTLLFAHGL